MSGPSRRPSAPDRLRPIAAGLMRVVAAVTVLAVVAGCSAPAAATPLYSIVIEPTPLSVGEQARQAFVENVLAGDLAYHVAFDGFVYGAGSELAVTGSLDVAGKDYQLAATYTFPKPPRASYAIRFVGGTAWVRIDNGKWKKDATFRAADTNSPFAYITRQREVKLAKTETIGGEALHRVTFENSQIISLTQIRAGNLTDEDYKRSSFELLVDDDGEPVSGTARIEGVGRVSNQLQEIVIQLDVVFSKVGAKVVIKAP
jgi:hypothetical protein